VQPRPTTKHIRVESVGKTHNLFFSVRPQCPLCLCGEYFSWYIHHGDTEFTEIAQRVKVIPTMLESC
jgi:hypothetical protein